MDAATLRSNKKSIDIPADFKSTLPPRKRAKTQEEKEQRRIERILRNRKAAHQSREKKRIHLKFLEDKCSIMERILCQMDLNEMFRDQQDNLKLVSALSSLGSEQDLLDQAVADNVSDDEEAKPSSSVAAATSATVDSDIASSAPSFNFSCGGVKDERYSAGMPNQIPSPSTSISTTGSVSMSPHNMSLANGDNIKLEDDDDVSNIMLSQLSANSEGLNGASVVADDDEDLSLSIDMDTFALNLQQQSNTAKSTTMYEDYFTSSAAAASSTNSDNEQDLAFELEAAGTNTNNLLLMGDNELNGVSMETAAPAPTATSPSVIEAATQALGDFAGASTNGSAASNDMNIDNNNILSDSFDLDNWRDPAVIVSLP